MKKTLTILSLVSLILFSCSSNVNDKAKIEKTILDSIKKSDSLKNVLTLDSLKKDSISKASIIDIEKNKKNESKTINKSDCECGTKYQLFSGVITEIGQAIHFYFIKIKTDDSKEIFCPISSSDKIGNEKIIIKEASGNLTGDGVYNNSLLNKHYSFCLEYFNTGIDSGYALINACEN